jgi:nucleotide-binding universal stress UspA family protein
MSTILVPIDFSDNSKEVFLYALLLGQKLRMNVKLLYVYNRSFVPTEPMYFKGDNSLGQEDEKRLKNFARTSLEVESKSVPSGVTLAYETIIDLSPANGIRFAADDEAVDLIIMGTTNKTGVFANWLGSTSSQVSETASKPVLLVPSGLVFKGFKKIVVASHYESAGAAMLREVASLAGLFKASLHFVHVVDPGDKSPHELIGRAITEQLKAMELPVETSFEVTSIQHEQVAAGLKAFAVDQEADLLVVVNKRRSGWSSLLFSSLTQQLALTTEKPLLVFHEERVEIIEKWYCWK